MAVSRGSIAGPVVGIVGPGPGTEDSDIIVGVTTVTDGTNGYLLYDNNGILGVTPNLPGPFFGNPVHPAVNLTGSDGVALTAMRSDAVLQIDQTITPTWTGLHTFNNGINANTVAIGGATIGTDVLAWAGTASGSGVLSILNVTAIPAGGATGTGYKFSSTSNFGVFFGSGAPTLSAAQGSLYLRSDGAPQYNTNGSTGWTAIGGVNSVSNVDGTLTISPTTGVVVASLNLAHANIWSANQTFGSGNFLLAGSSSGTLTIKPPAAAGSNTLTFPAGTTDFSATGGSSQYLKQSSLGGAVTVGTIPAAEIPGSALTRVDDTNVTLTLGGSPTTALLNAASITVGWSGTLSLARGGLGGDQSAATAGQIPIFPGSGGAAVPSSFVQTGTGAVGRAWLSKGQDIVNIKDFGAAVNGSTNDTAALQAAISNSSPGVVLTIPDNGSGAVVSQQAGGANGYAILLSDATNLSGNGRYAKISPAAGGTTGIDVIRIVSGGANNIGMTLESFWIDNLSGLNDFRDGIRIDTQTTVGNLQALQIRELFVGDGKSGGYAVRMLNNEATNLGGGLTYSTITDNFALYGGLYLQKIGDSNEVSRNVIAPNASDGSGLVYISQVAGAANFRFLSNNVTVNGGIIQDSGTMPIYAFNEIELNAASIESHNSMIDILGSGSTVGAPLILYNTIAATQLSTGSPVPIRIDAATHAYIDGNRLGTNGAYPALIITSSATSTVVGAGNSFYNYNTNLYVGPAYTDNGVDTRWVVTTGLKNVSDTSITATAFQRTVAFTNITAARTVTLPAANTFGKGEVLVIRDDSGLSTPTLTISAIPAGSDTINGVSASTVVVNSAQGVNYLMSDGVSAWITPKFTLAGDITGASITPRVVGTLATVNSNVGTFGSATQVGQFTVNGKGLITAASNVTLTGINSVAYPASYTQGGIPWASATNTIGSSALLAANALMIGGGSGAAPSTTTTGANVLTVLSAAVNAAGGIVSAPSSLTANAIVIGGGAFGPATTTTGTGVVTALGVNVGTAGSFVVNGGALGSPSSVGTLPAYTLGGTISGGGNQINNVVIGASTPLAGAFTTLTTTGTAQFKGARNDLSGAAISVRQNGVNIEWGYNAANYTSGMGSDGNGTPYIGFAAWASGTGANYTTNPTGVGSIAGVVLRSDGSGGLLVSRLAVNSTNTAPTDSAIFTAAGGFAVGTISDPGVGLIYTNSASYMIRTKTSYNNGAGASAGTITNAPAVGNPTKWIPIDDNGTTRYIPAW